jgi:hypothetical protein
MLDNLIDLKAQIEGDLRVSTSIEDNLAHLEALDSVEYLIEYLS